MSARRRCSRLAIIPGTYSSKSIMPGEIMLDYESSKMKVSGSSGKIYEIQSPASNKIVTQSEVGLLPRLQYYTHFQEVEANPGLAYVPYVESYFSGVGEWSPVSMLVNIIEEKAAQNLRSLIDDIKKANTEIASGNIFYPPQYAIYGINIDMSNSDPLTNTTYTNSAVGLEPSVAVISTSTETSEYGIYFGKSSTIMTDTKFFDMEYCNGVYVLVGESGIICISYDLETWEVVNSGVTNDIKCIVQNGNKFYAIGPIGYMIMSKDGRNWYKVPNGCDTAINTLLACDNLVYAAGDNGVIIYCESNLEIPKFLKLPIVKWEFSTNASNIHKLRVSTFPINNNNYIRYIIAMSQNNMSFWFTGISNTNGNLEFLNSNFNVQNAVDCFPYFNNTLFFIKNDNYYSEKNVETLISMDNSPLSSESDHGLNINGDDATGDEHIIQIENIGYDGNKIYGEDVYWIGCTDTGKLLSRGTYTSSMVVFNSMKHSVDFIKRINSKILCIGGGKYTEISTSPIGSATTFSYGGWENIIKQVFEVKPCILSKNGEVVCFLDENNYKLSVDGDDVSALVTGIASSGNNVMVRFKKMYYSAVVSGDILSIRIATYKVNGDYICDAFLSDDGNATERDYIYVGAYPNSFHNSTMRSLSGLDTATLSSSIAITDVTRLCEENSDVKGYSQLSYSVFQYLEMLSMLIAKSPLYVSLLSKGSLNSTGAFYTNVSGKMDTAGLFSGKTFLPFSKIFGIENLFSGYIYTTEGFNIEIEYRNPDPAALTDPITLTFLYKACSPYSSIGTGYAVSPITITHKTGVSSIKTVSAFMKGAILLPYSIGSDGSASQYICEAHMFEVSDAATSGTKIEVLIMSQGVIVKFLIDGALLNSLVSNPDAPITSRLTFR